MRLSKAKWFRRAKRYLELFNQRNPDAATIQAYRRRFKQREFDKALHAVTQGGAA